MRGRDKQGAVPVFSHRLHRWFALYLRRYFRRHFTAVRIARRGLPPRIDDRPLVFYTNHPSWWDPALFMLLARELYPGRPGYGPMEAAALERYGFFRRLGVFGIEPDTPAGARKFLQVSTAVLARPEATLWVTAEGTFSDPRRRPVKLKAGIAHLARRLPRAALIPLALEYPFWDQRLPEALVRFGEPIPIDRGTRRSAGEWQSRIEDGLETAMNALAAESMRRDPSLFHDLLTGRTGVGGMYDGWRRLAAAARGERFHSAHGTGRS